MESHRKKLKRGHEPGHFHELTFSCYRRKPLLTNEAWRRELPSLIDAACAEAALDSNAFVFIPEHIHLLIYPKTEKPRIGRFVARFKQLFSRHVREILVANHWRLFADLTIRERPGKACFRFWQEGGGFDRNLYNPEAIEACINYIHLNPVNRGLCQRAIGNGQARGSIRLEFLITAFPGSRCHHRICLNRAACNLPTTKRALARTVAHTYCPCHPAEAQVISA